jgi:hypothetical protein
MNQIHEPSEMVFAKCVVSRLQFKLDLPVAMEKQLAVYSEYMRLMALMVHVLSLL